MFFSKLQGTHATAASLSSFLFLLLLNFTIQIRCHFNFRNQTEDDFF